MAIRVDLTGKKYGYLTVIRRAGNSVSGRRRWICKCKCGNETIVSTSGLNSGKTQSCGCKRYESHNKRHGLTKTDIHLKWCQMRQRCKNPNCKAYKSYGATGVEICQEWDNFEAFRDWAYSNGYAEGLSLDRIDNSKGYSPENCRWVTWGEQCNNRRSSIRYKYNGKVKNLKQWCNELGLNYHLIYQRIKRDGYTFEEAINSSKCERRRSAHQ